MYNVKYILGFTNDLNELYEIYFEFLDYSGAVTQLTGMDDCLTLRCTTGDENKLEPILGTECLVNICVEENTPISIADLVAEHDNDIRVTVYRDEDYTKNAFQGFIVVEDNSQPFLDPPFALSVRALDGLGLLNGVDLVDSDGFLFVGNHSVLSWIAQILAKTDQTLNLRIYFNFFESSFAQNIGALEQVYLNAITFSQGDAFNSTPDDPTIDPAATAADDCYTALEKIVRCFRCRLFQEDGRWNLVSLYEYLNPDGMSFKEYSFGAPVSGIVPFTVVDSGINQNYNVAVGRDQIIHPVQDDQIIYLKLATKWIKLTYTYDQSQNKVCNQDFSEGDRDVAFDETISSAIIDTAIQPVVNLPTQGYDTYCWEHFNGNIIDIADFNAYPTTATTATAFIRDVLDALGYSINRFAVLKSPGVNRLTFLRSQRFLIDTNDILQMSISWRSRIDMGSSGTGGYPIAFVYLYGDDGTFWAMKSFSDGTDPLNPTKWFATDSNFHAPLSAGGSFPIISSPVTTTAQWSTTLVNQSASLGGALAKSPVSGSVEILLIYPEFIDGQEYWFKDLNVTILPYLNGTYQQLKGDYNFSSSNSNIKQTEADDVQLSDSPKRYFKGALLHANGDLCTPTWGRSVLPMSESFRFTQLMERIMFNHLGRMLQKIEGSFRGLVYVPADDVTVIRPNGFLNSYNFTEGEEPTKRFMLTSFEKDFGTGQSRNVYVEVLKDQNDTGFLLPDQYKFSYIFQ